MRYLSIFTHTETDNPPSQDEIDAMGVLIDSYVREGKLVLTEGCLPTSLGARITREGDTYTTVDGPFTEAKEVVGGFAILNAESLDEAKALARRFMDVAGEGTCEIRQLYEVPAYDGTALQAQ